MRFSIHQLICLKIGWPGGGIFDLLAPRILDVKIVRGLIEGVMSS